MKLKYGDMLVMHVENGTMSLQLIGRNDSMNSLQKVFAGACPLRFVNWLDLGTIVPQCAMKVTFTYKTGKSTVKFRKPKGEKA